MNNATRNLMNAAHAAKYGATGLEWQRLDSWELAARVRLAELQGNATRAHCYRAELKQRHGIG